MVGVGVSWWYHLEDKKGRVERKIYSKDDKKEEQREEKKEKSYTIVPISKLGFKIN